MKENSKQIFRDLIATITLDESKDEIKSIALILLQKVFGLSLAEIMAGQTVVVTPEVSHALRALIERINNGEPVQYVVGEAFFFGRSFFVNPSVLIPRPETEEIIRTIVSWAGSPQRSSSPTILDIGTGSGCIPVTLSLELRGSRIFALDVSVQALAVARKNSELHAAKVTFIEHDILSGPVQTSEAFDAIVSNPPYVTVAEKNDMRRNVRDFEPHLALFVPDDDPLLFYRAIVANAASLNDSGLLVVEINERYSAAVRELFTRSGLSDVEVIKDLSGKDRIIKGVKKQKL